MNTLASPRIALVGDHNPAVVAHQCIPRALELARAAADVDLEWDWIATDAIDAANPAGTLARFSGVWLVPASPYHSMQGALAAVRFARETHRPFLGTCGGFQHALIEFARNVAGIAGADHAETHPEGPELVVTRLACSLVDQSGTITFTPGSRLHDIFGGAPTHEGYRCNYGPNPAWRARLEAAGFRFTGFDESGAIRAGELPGAIHPFFIGTLFQPERSASTGLAHPLITAFARAAATIAHDVNV